MSEEKISEALNIEYEPFVKEITIIDKKELQKIKREKRENLLHSDFETARQNIKDMIHTGMEAIDGIMKVAIAGDSPRAYEVASLLLKTISDINKDLIDIHKKTNDAEKEKITNINTTNNSIYVGSTTDLQNILNKSRSQNKDLDDENTQDD
jgi:predicted GIY-YIG superfamily endonuclease